MDNPVFSFVIPVYNEEDAFPELHRRLCALLDTLPEPCEVVFVDDGSRDRSLELMTEAAGKDPRLTVVQLSRNFGHQVAISAGMDLARGEAVIIMDADLQDPPEVVQEMIERWREGYEVVYGLREERKGETWFKRTTASVFYRLLRRLTDLDMPADVGDFRLVDRKALDAFRGLRERNRYVRGLFTWVGFKQTGVRYVRSGRVAGETKYPLRKMIKLATDGVIGFSMFPLRIALNIGFLFAAAAFVGGIAAVAIKLEGRFVVPGWVSIVVAVAFLGGVQLMILGIMGEYVGRIYEEVKARPLYIVREVYKSGEAKEE
jgi:polyisoprenyl-phosphate glycosyltransferase